MLSRRIIVAVHTFSTAVTEHEVNHNKYFLSQGCLMSLMHIQHTIGLQTKSANLLSQIGEANILTFLGLMHHSFSNSAYLSAVP